MKKRKLIHCKANVDKSSIRRESIDGIEHIIITSFTLPDDIVMNGILYPAKEVDKSFMTLERTQAPVEHPTDTKGNFIPAGDPIALNSNFYVGAYNANVERVDGRVKIDKVINVQKALESDRGRRLLDRIDELETNNDPRPVHTSVGVFIDLEELDNPIKVVNGPQEGIEYLGIASGMMFDHDAILLDSVGAAQPGQGVGMAINSAGESIEVDNVLLPDVIEANAEGMSFNEIREAVEEALERNKHPNDKRYVWVRDIYPDDNSVVYSLEGEDFEASFAIDETGRATIVSIPLPVERDVTYTTKANSQKGDPMKEVIVNALKKAGISTDGLSDTDLLAAYNTLQVSQSNDEGGGSEVAGGDNADIAEVVANALKPLSEKIDGLEGKLAANEDGEKKRLAEVVANSGKYPALDAESAEALPVEKLKEMAAHCGQSFGISPTINHGGVDESQTAPTEMPE
jgi:hypothetical protein